MEEMNQWLPRLHALVIGPGLGRSAGTGDVVKVCFVNFGILYFAHVMDQS